MNEFYPSLPLTRGRTQAQHQAVLKAIRDGARTRSEIARLTRLTMSQAQTSLQWLAKKDLVLINFTGQVSGLTPRGRERLALKTLSRN